MISARSSPNLSSMERWHGRVALVTGASEGVGESISRELVKAGVKVVGCARSFVKLQKLAVELNRDGGSFLPLRCDLSQEAEILDMFERITAELGGIDICINNAVAAFGAPLMSGATVNWKEMIDVNVMALCICTREAVKSMQARAIDDGHIIQINSFFGHKMPNAGIVHFLSATKQMVTALTEGLRNELRAANSHIRVTSVSPGLVLTRAWNKLLPHQEELVEQMLHSKRRLDVKDIADAVLYALSCPPHVQVHELLVRGTEEEDVNM